MAIFLFMFRDTLELYFHSKVFVGFFSYVFYAWRRLASLNAPRMRRVSMFLAWRQHLEKHFSPPERKDQVWSDSICVPASDTSGTFFLSGFKTLVAFRVLLVLQWSDQAKWVPLLFQPETEMSLGLSTVSSVTESAPLGVSPVDMRISQLAAVVPGEGRLASLGFSKSVIDRLSYSRADSTKKQYRSKWTTFVAWDESYLNLRIQECIQLPFWLIFWSTSL